MAFTALLEEAKACGFEEDTAYDSLMANLKALAQLEAQTGE